MKHFKLIEDTLKNRMIVSILAIFVLSLFNVWFSYRGQIAVHAALAHQIFYIDNQLSGECLNYVTSTRTCGASSGIRAWSDLSDGLKAIKDLQSNGTIELGGHNIYIRSGKYYDRVVDWPYGANDNKRNFISGYNNEIPVISGAKILSNWSSEGNDIYSTTDLSGTNYYLDVRDIYQDDVRLTEAEYPNNGAYYTIDDRGDGTYIEDTELIALYNQNPDLVLDATVEFLGRDLYGERFKIQSVDLNTNRAYFYPDNTIGSAPYPNAIYHLVGKLDFLDQAGEFYYQVSADGKNGEVAYVKFAAGDNPNGHLMEVPDQEIFHFGYGSTRPAYYLTVSNLELKNATQGVYFQGERDYIATYGNDFVHHITLDNINSHDHARFGFILGGNVHHVIVKNSKAENNNAAGFYFLGFYKPVCGDGRLDNWTIGPEYQTNPEQCDDGNLIDGDGCSSTCGLTPGYNALAVEPWNDYFKSYITIDNNIIRNNKSNGISFSYLAEGIISNNTLEYNGAHSVNSGIGTQRGSDNQIFGNSISYQGGNGILIEGGVDEKAQRFDIHDNVIHYSAYNVDPHISAYFGIWLDEANENNVYNNTFYAENGRGFALGGGDNNKIVYNKFLDIFGGVSDEENRYAWSGYLYEGEGESLKNNIIAHNIFTGKFNVGIYMKPASVNGSGTIVNNLMANNIFYSSRSDKVQMNDLSPNINHSINTYNNNLYYAPNSSNVVYNYQDVDYSSLSSFRSASSQESLSLQTNPLFTNFSQENFTLQSNSPAIDQGMLISGVNTNNFQGFAPDIGPLEYASGPTCSNSILESGETCDDGNLNNGDGCSSSCQIEQETPPPASCTDNIQNGNETGIDCGGSCPACDNGGGNPLPPPPENPPIVCGNSITESGETCDDGNTNNGDGCSYLCQIEEDNQATSTTNSINVLKAQGFLAKAPNDPRVYYINQESKRYYIPNLTTFYTWFNNFNSLQVIDQVTLNNSYPYEGRLTVKPGNLVKFQDSNKVYAIEPEKTLRWITSGNIFSDFGYDFNKIIHLPQEDFSYYTIGENITTSDIHPSGQLLKHGSYPQVFYVQDGIEYWIKDQNTFLSLGFKWQDIITIPVRYWYTRILDNLSFKLKDW
ncbi:DUF4215 domain-containing protein [Candidatus Nomurabacteria bacterium]|nr:DUF4215 domain-containing protein [Candidatus Nomurabacteria bacterium]